MKSQTWEIPELYNNAIINIKHTKHTNIKHIKYKYMQCFPLPFTAMVINVPWNIRDFRPNHADMMKEIRVTWTSRGQVSLADDHHWRSNLYQKNPPKKTDQVVSKKWTCFYICLQKMKKGRPLLIFGNNHQISGTSHTVHSKQFHFVFPSPQEEYITWNAKSVTVIWWCDKVVHLTFEEK